MIPDALPRLAVGSHKAGSGKACIMNAISYLSGETTISDHPDCVDPFLAYVAQYLNDAICTHHAHLLRDAPHLILCDSCTHAVWMFGTRLMGTAERWPKADDPHVFADPYQLVVYTRMTVEQLQTCPASVPTAVLLDDLLLLMDRFGGAPPVAHCVTLRNAVFQETCRLETDVAWGGMDRGFRRTAVALAGVVAAIEAQSPDAVQEMARALQPLHRRDDPLGWAHAMVDRWEQLTGYSVRRPFTPTDVQHVADKACLPDMGVPA